MCVSISRRYSLKCEENHGGGAVRIRALSPALPEWLNPVTRRTLMFFFRVRWRRKMVPFRLEEDEVNSHAL